MIFEIHQGDARRFVAISHQQGAMWGSVLKIGTLGELGHWPDHHGMIFEIHQGDARRFVAISHQQEGQAMYVTDDEQEARRTLFEGYREKHIFRDLYIPSLFSGRHDLYDLGAMYATVELASRLAFTELLSVRHLYNEYNVAFNNCQHWAERAWYHFGGPKLKGWLTSRQGWRPLFADFGVV